MVNIQYFVDKESMEEDFAIHRLCVCPCTDRSGPSCAW